MKTRGRPKGSTKKGWEAVRDCFRSIALRFEIDGRKDIAEPVQPGAEKRIEQIAEREHLEVSTIKDRAYRPNRKRGGK